MGDRTTQTTRRALAAGLATLSVAAGVAACGTGDDVDSSAREAPSQVGTDRSAGGQSATGRPGAGKAGSGGPASLNGSGYEGPTASEFTPRRHDDSGGGSEQFKVRGADNSVQEFGEEASEGELEAAATGLHNFFDARAEGNYAAACEYLAAAVVESFSQLPGGSSCAQRLAQLTDESILPALRREARRVDVGAVRLEGEQAFVIYRGQGKTVNAMPMVSEGGRWKVSSLTGVPLN